MLAYTTALLATEALNLLCIKKEDSPKRLYIWVSLSGALCKMSTSFLSPPNIIVPRDS
jgi:hypothetical protein